MKPNKKPSPASHDAAPAAGTPATKLNLTPEQAKREAGKLHDLRDDLEARKTPAETDAPHLAAWAARRMTEGRSGLPP